MAEAAQKFEMTLEVLLIEDSLPDIRLTQKVFERSRWNVEMHVVQDGGQALDYLFRRNGYEQATRPTVVLLDLNLPQVSGLEVLKTIKSNQELQGLPVIVLTTSGNDEDVSAAYRSFANAYIRKPVRFDDFVRAIETMNDFWLSTAVLPRKP